MVKGKKPTAEQRKVLVKNGYDIGVLESMKIRQLISSSGIVSPMKSSNSAFDSFGS